MKNIKKETKELFIIIEDDKVKRGFCDSSDLYFYILNHQSISDIIIEYNESLIGLYNDIYIYKNINDCILFIIGYDTNLENNPENLFYNSGKAIALKKIIRVDRCLIDLGYEYFEDVIVEPDNYEEYLIKRFSDIVDYEVILNYEEIISILNDKTHKYHNIVKEYVHSKE